MNDIPDRLEKKDRNRFRDVELLGQGSTCVVYRAYDLRLSRKVVIRLLKKELSTKNEFVEFFKNESRFGLLPGKTNVHEALVGELDADDPYVIMEYLDGILLSEFMKRNETVITTEAAHIMADIASGLDSFHRNGLIHGELNPSDILLAGKPCKAIIMDYGLACCQGYQTILKRKIARSDKSYMPPEHDFTSLEKLQPSSDIWSLGAIMYEYLTGAPPEYEIGGNFIAPLKLLELEGVSEETLIQVEGLSTIVSNCLEKTPEKRPYRRVETLVQDLMIFLSEARATPVKRKITPVNLSEKHCQSAISEAPSLPNTAVNKLSELNEHEDREEENPVITGETESGPDSSSSSTTGKSFIRNFFSTIMEPIFEFKEALIESFSRNTGKKNSFKPLELQDTGPPPSLNVPIAPPVVMEFILIKPGEFDMGSSPDDPDHMKEETPLHRVRITKAFWLGKFPVTQAQWEAVMGNNPSAFKGDPDRPVEMVSWYDCQAFIEKLNERLEGTFRLPTEAEWEYACRAGATTRYYWGDSMDGDCCWYISNSSHRTHPAGLKRPNNFGLFDMLGNVGELCFDWFEPDYYEHSPVNDPQGPEISGLKVYRGGSFCASARQCRIATRAGVDPATPKDSIGFRVVKVI